MLLNRLVESAVSARRTAGAAASVLFVTAVAVQAQSKASSPPTQESGKLSLQQTDLDSFFNSNTRPGKAQIIGERVFWIHSTRHVLSSFDLQGKEIASLPWKQKNLLRESRYIGFVEPSQEELVIDDDQAYLSADGSIYIWNLADGQLSDAIDFQRPVRLLRAWPDRLLVVRRDEQSLLAFTDRKGRIISRFGERIVYPRNLKNDAFNDFFAFATKDQVVLLFQHYPVFQVYSMEGILLEQGEYQLPEFIEETLLKETPAMALIATSGDEIGTGVGLVTRAKYHDGRFLVVFSQSFAGILDDQFNLIHSRYLLRTPQGFIPLRILDIDAENARLLVYESHPSAKHRDLRFIPFVLQEEEQ